MSRLSIFAALLCFTLKAGASNDAPSQVAVDWNAAVLSVAEQEDGFLTLKGLRTVAMLHLAMHDALASISGRYAQLVYSKATQTADPLAAATSAAFEVAVAQFPDQKGRFARLNERWLDASDTANRAAGVRLGAATAAAVLSARDGDGWDGEAEYRWHPMAPGVYAEFHEHSGTPQGFVFGAGWANAKGFALVSPDQFRSEPPPAIDSDAYTKAFNEVKDVGRFQSMSRTPDQTHIALWWKDFVENSHNRLARRLVVEEKLSLEDAVRLLALLNMSVFDAYVASFDNKFFYNHWRPFTAIRWADNDGNPQTGEETTWTNTHRHTYAFPSYPSAHGTACAAAMTAMSHVLGDRYAFTMETPTVDVAGPFSGKINMQPTTRQFSSFLEAADECALSRVYLGIHFRYDSDAGVELGRRVGLNVVDNLLIER